MLFELTETTECVLTTFVGRTQKSGPEDVPAVTFRLQLASVSNALLDRFSKTIRHTVYRAVEGQEQLPGIEDTTPILQSKDLTEWKPDTCLEGWTVMLSRGVNDGDTGLQMGSCKVDDFRFDFHDGGHMDVDFRISTADVDEAGAGMLWGRQKRKVFVIIKAPEMPADKAPVIDGTPAAFKADHPDAGDLFADGATDPLNEFDDRHNGDFGQADDDSAGPGAGSSDDAPFGEPQKGENWPFPQGDNADTASADAGGDAAEFEAGAAAAIAKAGVAPRGRRGRKMAGVVE